MAISAFFACRKKRNFIPMCYHKSLAQKEAELLAHYKASFEFITEELEITKR